MSAPIILQPGDYAYYVNGRFVHVDLVTETLITETLIVGSPILINTDVKYKLNMLGDVLISDEIVGSNMSNLITKLSDNIVYDISRDLLPPDTAGGGARNDYSVLITNVTAPGYYLRNGYIHVDIVDKLIFEHTHIIASPEILENSGTFLLSQTNQLIPAIYVYPNLEDLANYLEANIIHDI